MFTPFFSRYTRVVCIGDRARPVNFLRLIFVVGSRHSLVFAVYEPSFSPTDLTSHLNVALECGCVLSTISVMRDEVIGYKSPVLEDNSLAGGQVRELGLSGSRADFR